jgi:hypothetical protein
VRPLAAWLALAAVTGCSADSDLVLTIQGDAPGAVVLFARVVDDQGSPSRVYSAGDAEKPVVLPATIHLQLSHTRRVGVVVWLADAGGTIVAQGRTESCAEVAARGKYTVTLAPAPDGWSPAVADRCRCDPADPLGPMCPAVDGPDGGSEPDAALGTDAEPASDGGDDLVADATAPSEAGVDAGAEAGRDAAADAPADARDAAPVPRDAAPDRAPDVGAADLPASSVAGTLFGFDLTAPDWTSADTTLVRDTAVHTEGAASVAFTTGGTSTLRSRSFATKGLGVTGTRLSVDLFVNEKQIGDANTEMWVDCQSASVFGVYMGYKALGALKAPGWTALSYTMPASVKQALSGDFTDCQIWFQLVGKGLFRFDHLAFVP